MVDISNVSVVHPKKKIKQIGASVVVSESTLRSLLAQQAELVQTHTHLCALQASIKQYGLTRSLVAFADHDKALSAAIPEIPALESLNHDRSVKNSADATAALEGVINKTFEHVRALGRNFIEAFKSFVRMKFGDLNAIEKKMREIVDKIKTDHLSLNREKLDQKEKLPKYTDLLATLKAICACQEAAGKVFALNPPTTGDEFYGWADKVHKLMQPQLAMSSHTFGEQGEVGTNHACALHEDDYPEATLHALGYDSLDKLEALHRAFVDAKIELEKIQNYLARYDHILSDWKVAKEEMHILIKAESIYNALIDNDRGLHSWTKRWPMTALKALAACAEKTTA